MSNNVKNWVIGILVVLLLILGASVFLNKSNNVPVNTPATQSEVSDNFSNNGNQNNKSQNVECISAEESWNFVGQEKCVEFYVSSPYRSRKGNIFLNERRDYKNGFTVWIPRASVNNFSVDPISEYGYKTIRVFGQIRMYQGHPEIIVNSPNQILTK